MNIEIHIEELVLYGFTHIDRYALAESLSAELTRLISQQGQPALFDRSVVLPHLHTRGNLGSSYKSAGLGEQVAQAIYEGMHAGELAGTR